MSDLKQELTAVLREIYAAPGPIAGDPIWLADRLLPFVQAKVDAAVALVGRCGRCGELGHTELAHEPEMKEAIAAAVAAERERCATIKPKGNVHTQQIADQPSYRKGYMDALYDLRAAIRKGEKP